MINQNVELREMDIGDIRPSNWSNQTISKGMALKLYGPEIDGPLDEIIRSAEVHA